MDYGVITVNFKPVSITVIFIVRVQIIWSKCNPVRSVCQMNGSAIGMQSV